MANATRLALAWPGYALARLASSQDWLAYMANYILHVKGQHTDNAAAAAAAPGQWSVVKRVSVGKRGEGRWVVPLNIFYTPQIDRTIRGRRWPYGTEVGTEAEAGARAGVGRGTLSAGTRAHRCATTINEIYSICTDAE